MAAARPPPKEDRIPIELKEKLATFDTHLSELEMILSPVLSVNRINLTEKLDPVDAAKTDLVAAYTINSLFWMYMNVCGINPKEHSVRQELGRIQSYMQRVKELEDKKKAPKLDKESTKRFVKSALWQAAKQKKGASEPQPGPTAEQFPASEPQPGPTAEQTSSETQSEGKFGKKLKKKDD